MQTTTFAELGLSAKVLSAIETTGYTTPTPIQAEAIPIAVTGRDVLGIAQTGTGKTASFVLPMLTRLETGRARARMPRSLILAPTRELAAQVAQAFETYGKNHKLTMALLIGGVSFDDQNKKLDRGVDVLIATPGRLLDHFQRGRLLMTGVEILVIDEADRMLDMGFIPDIEKICRLLPPRRQTLFFSATMPPEISRLVEQFLKDPQRVEVAPPATTAKTITQRFQFCPDAEDWAKREALRELIRGETVKNAIIFCNRKRDVAILLKSLTKHGFNAGALHGDMDQTSRMETLDDFRSGKIQFLAASDVAARGLDIPEVSHVFNFDLPWAADDYVHRIGRTGRAGRQGSATSLVTAMELKTLKDIEKISGGELEWIGDPPTQEDYASAGKRRGRGRGARTSEARSTRERPGRRRGERRPSEKREIASLGPSSISDENELDVRATVTETRMAAEDDSGQAAKPRRRRRGGRGRGDPTSGERTVAAQPQAREDRPSKPTAAKAHADGERKAPARKPEKKAATTPQNHAFGDSLPAFLRRPVRA